MSIQALSWALAQRVGSHTDKHVLIVAASYARHGDVAPLPTVQKIASCAEMKERSVMSSLRRLKTKGVLTFSIEQDEDGSDRINLQFGNREG